MSRDYTGFFIEWTEEWSQFAGGCNWYTFHPIVIEFEDDRIMGGIEATFIVLGLGFRLRWNYTVTEKVQRIKDQVAEIMDDKPAA